MSRRKPPPTEEELALWQTVTRSVAPLAAKAASQGQAGRGAGTA